MNAAALFDELVKMSAVSDEAARRSLDRLDQLEKSKPTAGQVARYGALGAGAGTVAGALGNAIEHGSAFKGSTPKAKALNLAAAGAKGAIGGGVVPLVRAHLDRKAEEHTLKKYMAEKSAFASPTSSDTLQQKVAMSPNELLVAAFQDELEKIAGEGGLSREVLEVLMKNAGVMDSLRSFYHGGTSAEGIPMTGLKHWLGNANPLQGAGGTLADAGAAVGGKLRAAGSAVADKAQALKARVSNVVSGGTSAEGIPMTGIKHWLGAGNPLQGGMQTMREAPGLMRGNPVADAQQAAAGVARVRPRAPSRMQGQFDQAFGMKAASAFKAALAKTAAPPIMSPSAARAVQRTMQAGPAPAMIGGRSLLGRPTTAAIHMGNERVVPTASLLGVNRTVQKVQMPSSVGALMGA